MECKTFVKNADPEHTRSLIQMDVYLAQLVSYAMEEQILTILNQFLITEVKFVLRAIIVQKVHIQKNHAHLEHLMQNLGLKVLISAIYVFLAHRTLFMGRKDAIHAVNLQIVMKVQLDVHVKVQEEFTPQLIILVDVKQVMTSRV